MMQLSKSKLTTFILIYDCMQLKTYCVWRHCVVCAMEVTRVVRAGRPNLFYTAAALSPAWVMAGGERRCIIFETACV